MSWIERMIMGGLILRAPEGEGGGGGGGGAEGKGKGEGEGGGKGSGAGGGDDVSALKAANAALEARLAKLEAAGKPAGDDPGLDEKARKEREAKEKSASDTKAIEKALQFSLGAKDWLKTNATLLPKDIDGIFVAAEKENYSNAIEKDGAIKSAMVQEFFKVQANLDLLTLSQKTVLEDFLKLTKNGKQEKAQNLYETIFEPTFEMLKRIKKAEQLGKDGHQQSSDVDQAYRERMIMLSRKHYMGEKTNA